METTQGGALFRRHEQVVNGDRRVCLMDPRERYRFKLSIRWGLGPLLGVLMQNPSRASHLVNDMTVSRLCRWGRLWGFGAVGIVNIWPLRASRPDDLWAWLAEARRGDLAFLLAANRGQIRQLGDSADQLLVAFGAQAHRRDPAETWKAVHQFSRAERQPMYCLPGSSTFPKHPAARGRSAIPANATLERWQVPEHFRVVA